MRFSNFTFNETNTTERAKKTAQGIDNAVTIPPEACMYALNKVRNPMTRNGNTIQ